MLDSENSMQVSFFAGIRSKNPEMISLERFITNVRNGTWKVQTENYQLMKSNGHEKEATRVKGTMSAICVGCICENGHQEKNIVRLTGLIPIDLDHTNERTEDVFEKLRLLPYIAAVFISMSGQGVKAIVRVSNLNLDNYLDCFTRLALRITEETGAAVDPSGKNINRLCFGSYHPEAYYNPEVIPINIQEITQPGASATDKNEAAFRNAMKYLNKKQLYTKGNRNNYIYALLCLLRRRKMNEEDAEKWCMNYFELDREELAAIVKSAYKQSTRQITEAERERRRETAELNRKENINLIEEYIKERYKLRYNVVMKQTEIRHLPDGKDFELLTDYEENSMFRELLQNGHKIALPLLHSILNSDLSEPYDPFIDYFDKLPLWDGTTDYIGMLTATVTTTQSEHWECCFRKWLVAMVAGWLYPEVVNHTVLVIIGKQGIYKTTWSLKLIPPELERYRYSGVIDSHDKDGKLTLAQCGLINFEEIENLDRKELNKFKALVTQNVINERMFYGRNKEYMVRRASIIGSGNNKDILTDMTGNRRWLCFEVTDIQIPKEGLPYEGIYAQAKALIANGFRYWFDRQEMQQLNQRNLDFTLRSVEEEQLSVWFRKPEPGEPYTLMTASQVMAKLAQWTHMQLNVIRIGRALKAAEYEHQFLHTKTKVYRVIEIGFEDVRRQGL